MLRRVMVCLVAAAVLAPFAVRANAATGADDSTKTVLTVQSALALEAVTVPTPALAEEAGPAGDQVRLPLEGLRPRAGARWPWPGRDALTWSRVEAADGVFAAGAVAELPQLRVFALRLRADAFVKTTLKVTTSQRVHAYLDGAESGAKTKVEAAGAEPGTLEKELRLTNGDHALILVTELDGRGETEPAPWSLRVELVSEAGTTLGVDTGDGHRMTLSDLLDVSSPGGVDLSPDGRVLAITVNRPAAPREGRRSWIEFVDTRDGRVVRSLEGVGDLSGFEWAPGVPLAYSFVSRRDGKATLWVGPFDGEVRAVVEDVEDLGSTTWMPDRASILVSISEDGPEDPKNFKRYRGLTDRWSGSRDASSLYQVSVEGGVMRRLTAGDLEVSLQDVAPDGAHLLFTRNLRDDAQWPFSRDELVELDIATLGTRVLATEPWGLTARYSGDGRTLALIGPPQAFGGVGLAVQGEGVEANLYESQLFLMDRASGAVRAASRDLAPSIESIAWVGERGTLVATTTDRAREHLYQYDVARERWQQLVVPMDCVTSMSVSQDGSTVAMLATSVNVPSEVWVGQPRDWKPRRLRRFDGERIDSIRFGKVEDWNFAHGDDVLDGHVYYPPDFDPAKTYPLIVYYYGGTTPVTRTFGGRYPKEWWAAQGYLVYVVQPSGAVGYGQEFAARHVNNWGKTVADEIIAATQGFLDAHPYADRNSVGCIGASYGGFMTMLLLTRTDIFAAAVSHAGISSISSYWGEGNWGYSYSAGATARSYPWNRPDIYVDQSPLFAADRIHTPLLLLHGSIDDNVPPGESEQLYTALRVLGREVEFIKVDGERHWILDYDKRTRWSQSIVAWFDKHLKRQSAWWDELWPQDDAAKKD